MQIGASSPVLPGPRPDARAPADTSHAATKESDASRSASESRPLNEEQRAQVQTLKARDSEVRAHEAAHMAAAGGLARGGASFSYETGPDNRRYAVGGEVSIDTSPGKTPEETLQKAQTIRAAAQAPAKPSQQDLAVAASAGQMAAEARATLAAQGRSGDNGSRPGAQIRAMESYAEVARGDTSERGLSGINLTA